MRRIGLKLILPVAQLATAAILLHWGYAAYLPKGFDTAYMPTGRLLCDGINAPARLLSNFFEALLSEEWRWSISGSHKDILLFLTCSILLWYLVGSELDRRGLRKSEAHTNIMSARLLFNASSACWGTLLIIFNVANFGRLQDFGRWNNFAGNIVEGALFWGWSLILIIFPGLALLTAIRNKLGAPGFERL